ncbi:hypothetical protein HP467_01940 [Curtobacterium albidum]|uniref:Uncharacterized protein n=1 Tax=Curtobacterium citreum TaxID=2036 RepID=A0A850DMM6_9MICO|nr:hypothetical protein [Curtobacterium albidum]NUU26876.1 hypothetical protein [Curtobacterium albidum]
MTDNSVSAIPEPEEPAEWDPATDPDGYTWEDVRPHDVLLDVALNFTTGGRDDTRGGSLSLTVIVGGQVVSGVAISRRDWIDGVTAGYVQAGGTEHLGKLYNEVHEMAVNEWTRRDDAELPARARHFLHMRDVILGVGPGAIKLGYWRGVLADVSGWSFDSTNLPGTATE